MVKIKGILSYDGTHYLGWQSTRAGPSIQGTVQILLKQLLNKNSRKFKRLEKAFTR